MISRGIVYTRVELVLSKTSFLSTTLWKLFIDPLKKMLVDKDTVKTNGFYGSTLIMLFGPVIL